MLRHVDELGYRALPWVLLGGLAFGGAAALILPGLPGSMGAGRELATTTIQELAPILAALAIALTASGADSSPPRRVAAMVAGVGLWATFGVCASLAACLGVRESLGMSPDIFLHRISLDVHPATVVLGGLRAMLFAYAVTPLRVRRSVGAALLIEALTGLPLRLLDV